MVFPLMNLLAQQTTTTAGAGLYTMVGWGLLAAIIVAFLVFGLGDLMRLSWVRISAISSVSFDESIRRRVLWITPLAIVGAVVVSQLQNAVDPMDAIRQTTKVCLFATGLVVTLVAIILASTNLQKEIDTRVIYTIVSKPTTRLEIVLGKVWGFAKVSATILLIMGVFTYGYLHLRAWRLGNVISSTLQTLPAGAVNRPTLEYYQTAGLLSAKAMDQAASLQLLGRPLVDGEPRWMAGGQGQQFKVNFRLGEAEHPVILDALRRGARLSLIADLPAVSRPPNQWEVDPIAHNGIPMREDPSAAPSPATAPAGAAASQPATAPAGGAASPTTLPAGRPAVLIAVTIQAVEGDVLVQPEWVNKGQPIELVPERTGPVEIPLGLTPETLDRVLEAETFTVVVDARSPATQIAVGEQPLTLQFIEADGSPGPKFDPLNRSPAVQGSVGRYGQQLFGGPVGQAGVGVFRFRGANIAAADGDRLTLEFKGGIERGGEGLEELETIPEVEVRVRDPKTGATSEPATFRPETNRISYVSLPRSAFPDDGNFDLLVFVRTPNQWLGIQPQSVSLATATRSFALNLAKSLFILWLLSILVVTIAVFCSTFVSWPIAIVLTLVLLLGRWGVQQIGDASGPGIGSVISGQTDDAVKARIMRTGADVLARVLTVTSAFLPDISSFQATTDIERGISVPLSRFAEAGWVLLGYGVPIVLLAYLILKRKEVAP